MLAKLKSLFAKRSVKIITLLSSIAIVFSILWLLNVNDPAINYYGIHMRQSQLYAYLQEHKADDPDYALYCIGTVAVSFGERFMCFDTRAELDTIIAHRTEIQQQLEGRSS